MVENLLTIKEASESAATYGNKLFPVFLKLENLRLLIVGGGNVAVEKLQAILTNSPSTRIKMISLAFSNEIYKHAGKHKNIELNTKAYEASDLDDADIIIAAVNDITTSSQISKDANAIGKLVNVADKPSLCDFYLGSIVKKGNLKVAISTNGKSPTIAKRLKEVLNETLPAELDDVLFNMEQIRNALKGDFSEKVFKLNQITHSLAVANTSNNVRRIKKIRRVVIYVLFTITCMVAGHILLSYLRL